MEQKKRLSIEITPGLRDRIRAVLPWGVRGAVFRALIEHTVALVEQYGLGVAQLILDGKVHPSFIGANDATRRSEDQSSANVGGGTNGVYRERTPSSANTEGEEFGKEEKKKS
jgi:hypothetical protein